MTLGHWLFPSEASHCLHVARRDSHKPRRELKFFSSLSPNLFINLNQFASSFPVNTLHHCASNSFFSWIKSLANEVFRQPRVVFRSHGSIIYFGNSRQLCMPVCMYWKFQENTGWFLWGPQKTEINKKKMDLTTNTVWVLSKTPCFWVLNANASRAPISIFTENWLTSTQEYCFKGIKGGQKCYVCWQPVPEHNWEGIDWVFVVIYSGLNSTEAKG